MLTEQRGNSCSTPSSHSSKLKSNILCSSLGDLLIAALCLITAREFSFPILSYYYITENELWKWLPNCSLCSSLALPRIPSWIWTSWSSFTTFYTFWATKFMFLTKVFSTLSWPKRYLSISPSSLIANIIELEGFLMSWMIMFKKILLELSWVFICSSFFSRIILSSKYLSSLFYLGLRLGVFIFYADSEMLWSYC